MIIQWIVLGILLCFIVFSYIKHYSLKTRVMVIVSLLILSLLLVIPVFQFSVLTFVSLFLFERLWIVLAVVLFIESYIKKNNRIFLIIAGVISIIIYLFLRRMI